MESERKKKKVHHRNEIECIEIELEHHQVEQQQEKRKIQNVNKKEIKQYTYSI